MMAGQRSKTSVAIGSAHRHKCERVGLTQDPNAFYLGFCLGLRKQVDLVTLCGSHHSGLRAVYRASRLSPLCYPAVTADPASRPPSMFISEPVM